MTTEMNAARVTDTVDPVVVPAVICRWAKECQQADQCGHGKPHEADSHCEDPCVCYDIQPSRRAWCVLHQDRHNVEHDARGMARKARYSSSLSMLLFCGRYPYTSFILIASGTPSSCRFASNCSLVKGP